MESRLLSIQYLRAVAALMVVLYHSMRWTHPTFEIGAAGVDVFFVISGFILWTIAAHKPMTPGVFLARRAVRVVPLYWTLTLIVAALCAVWPRLVWDALLTGPHLLMSLAFIPHLNAEGTPFPLITAGWSLNYEVVFYLLFAVTLFFPERRRLLVLALLALAVPVIGFNVSGAWFLGANLMPLQFLAGAAFASWRLSAKTKPSRGVGVAMVVIALALYAIAAPVTQFTDIFRTIWWGVPAFFLVCGLVITEDAGGLPEVPVLRFLGDASYSIYLAHVVAVQMLAHVVRASSATFAPVAIVVSLAAGVATYYLLERPLARLFRRRRGLALPSAAV